MVADFSGRIMNNWKVVKFLNPKLVIFLPEGKRFDLSK